MLKLPWHIPHALFDKYFIVIPGKAFKGIHKPAIMGKGCLLVRDSRNAKDSSLLLRKGWIDLQWLACLLKCAQTHQKSHSPGQQLFLMCYNKNHTNISNAVSCVIWISHRHLACACVLLAVFLPNRYPNPDTESCAGRRPDSLKLMVEWLGLCPALNC